MVSTFTCPPVPRRRAPDADRPTHVLTIDIDMAAKTVSGMLATRFTPDLDTGRFQWRLWPNGPRPVAGGADVSVHRVTVDGAEVATTRPSPTVLQAPFTVQAGRTYDLTIDFVTTVPGAINDRIASGSDWMRLGSFYPTVEWEPGVGWNNLPPTSGFAETSVAPTADYTLTVNGVDGFDVLATGVEGPAGTWTAPAVRDVALAVGRFSESRGTANAGRAVDVVVGAHSGTGVSVVAYRDKVIAVLEQFADRYGAYPWATYSLAITPSLTGGIEQPAHVNQGPSTLGRTTSHEVGHMWFYGLLGSHQGRDPWLDEGLASWAEAVFEGAVANFRDRAIPADARGHLGEGMAFWESRTSSYYRGVYVQGTQALDALGPVEKVDCALRHHVARHAHQIATPSDLLASLEIVFPDARSTLERYGAEF
ncbi:MAG TPA: hypothetical protein VGA13_02630 [Acidimicrobiales bacterium]